MYRKLTSRLSALILVIFNVYQMSVFADGSYSVVEERGKALYGYSFVNLTNIDWKGCLEKCLENCRCLSLQICADKVCQLCSSNKNVHPLAFREQKGCKNYVFQRDFSQKRDQQCQQGCTRKINCQKRFICRCPPGYTGDRCQQPIKSCRGYMSGSRVPGKYKVFDDQLQLFEVFCDFDSNTTMTWTLIQSYQLRNNDQFKFSSFAANNPIHEDSPVWDSYRLSKSRMESIRQDSSKWRMTCRYDSDGLNYTDYVQADNDKINILTYEGYGCVDVEYINIRGESCPTQLCNIYVAQIKLISIFHYDSNKRCGFQAAGSLPCTYNSYSRGEDNFGWYGCINPAHRCSATETSTTQTWFGGY